MKYIFFVVLLLAGVAARAASKGACQRLMPAFSASYSGDEHKAGDDERDKKDCDASANRPALFNDRTFTPRRKQINKVTQPSLLERGVKLLLGATPFRRESPELVGTGFATTIIS